MAKIIKSPYGIVAFSIMFVFVSLVPFFFEGSGSWIENWWGALPFVPLAIFGMLFLPLVTIRYVLRDRLERFGWRSPEDIKKTAIFIALGIVLFLPVAFFFGGQESFQNYYSAGRFSLAQFLLMSILASLVYFTAQEFLFRGFLFWGLWYKVKYHSFWITSLVFTFFHLGKPTIEIPFAFFVSLFLSYLSFKTKSFLPAAITHFIMALTLNLFLFL